MKTRVALAALSWAILATTTGVAAETPAGAQDTRWTNLPYTDMVFQPTKYASLDQWKTRRAWLCDQVRCAAGLWPEPQRTPLNAQIFGRLEREGYTIEKVYFESSPGFYVTGNLYRPRDQRGKAPAVACPHGHWKNGRLHHDELGSIPARCITLARLGAVVFAYDMIGYNDSARQLQHIEPLLNSPQAALWGIGPLALQTWNSIRALDFLQSLPEVDRGRIGVTGASGGGTQTFILSAVDERVQVACPVNMISSSMQGGCPCENAAALRIETNNMEIGALLAPKPMLMVSATGDWTKNTPTVEFPMIRGIYALYGAADRVANVHIDAPHNYNLASRQAMYRWFARWLLQRDDADTITEGAIPVEKPEDMLVFSQGNLPANMLKPEALLSQFQAAARQKIDALKPLDAARLNELKGVVRLGLEHSVVSVFPAADEASCTSQGQPVDKGPYRLQRMVYLRNRRPVPALWITSKRVFEKPSAKGTDPFSGRNGDSPSGRVTICADPAGLAAADRIEDLPDDQASPVLNFIRRQAGRSDRVVVIEPFGTGGYKPPSDLKTPRGSTKFFTTFNRTDAAELVFDVLTVLGHELGRQPAAQVSLAGFAETGPPCLVALAMIPDDLARQGGVRAAIDLNNFVIDNDQTYVEKLFLPNLQRIGGLRAVAAVAASHLPVRFHNAPEVFDEQLVKGAAALNGTETVVARQPAEPAAIVDFLNAKR